MLNIKTKQKSNIKQGLTENNRQPSKFESQKAKKRDYQNNQEKAMKKFNMNQKNKANMWSTENS